MSKIKKLYMGRERKLLKDVEKGKSTGKGERERSKSEGTVLRVPTRKRRRFLRQGLTGRTKGCLLGRESMT